MAKLLEQLSPGIEIIKSILNLYSSNTLKMKYIHLEMQDQ